MEEKSFFRLHTKENAYATQRPRGLFAAVGKLVDAKTMNAEEIEEYWRNKTWFEANLPVPPFYAEGNPEKAITWFKDTQEGREMSDKMSFYRSMARKYGLQLFITKAKIVPGIIIYEDDFQIAVIDSLHSGSDFITETLA